MPETIITDGTRTPTLADLAAYAGDGGRDLWMTFDGFMGETYGSTASPFFSVCQGKPGWNVKYKKGSKSLCTVYPETDGFTALVVIGSDIIGHIAENRAAFGPRLLETYDAAKLFNGTYWLMIRVNDRRTLDDVKILISMKYPAKKRR